MRFLCGQMVHQSMTGAIHFDAFQEEGAGIYDPIFAGRLTEETWQPSIRAMFWRREE
jgi:hypothetical protein